MPPPRKPSPRRRERRSRSRSHSPRHRRRSRTRSRSHDRRSRSPQRRRSPERKRSPYRRRSPSPRKRSRSPRRRSRSHSPKRRSRSYSPRRSSPGRRRSHSPGHRNYPVKRPADSSGKRQGYRSRSPSPAPVKKPKDKRMYRDESPYQRQRTSRHSPSSLHQSPYCGKMYADQPSSSNQPLFPSGSSKNVGEIDYVTIVDRGPKKEKLNKRFETVEQVAQGPFDFEENITIGIHRGPQHIELDDDEDIEVNYEFNPKTFKMIFPKKDYVKAIFDREEIKAFHHDDILDEEAYVEKRTISIKPADKPKSRKYEDELDYKITIGTNRDGYGDRRMVHDSGSRSRPSRSSGYDDIPVTVRLDPRPDPRYEKIYREQQRTEDQSLMHEKVHRDPNDLRYNLMRRRSDGDRGDRDRGRDALSTIDARSRIEARRQESRDHSERHGRPDDRRSPRGSPPRSTDRKKATVKNDLPDFKNRPGNSGFSLHDGVTDGRRPKWGQCSVCNIALSSEEHALAHVNSEQHRSNEDALRGSPVRQIRHRGHISASPFRAGANIGESSGGSVVQRPHVGDMSDRKRHLSIGSDVDHRGMKRRSISDDMQLVSDSDYPRAENFDRFQDQYTGRNMEHYPGDSMYYGDHDNRKSSTMTGESRTKIVWIIGNEEMKRVQEYSVDCDNFGPNFGLDRFNISVIWKCIKGLEIRDVLSVVRKMKIEETKPQCIVLHIGGNDLEKMAKADFQGITLDMIDSVKQFLPGVKLVWSQLLPRSRGLNATRVSVDDEIAAHVLEGNGSYIRYPAIEVTDQSTFRMLKNGELDLTIEGIQKMMPVLKGGLVSIVNRNISIVPVLRNLPRKVDQFVQKNFRKKFAARKPLYQKPSFYKKKFPFFRR